MTRDEWLQCTDTSQMLDFLWASEPYHSVSEVFKDCKTTENWKDYESIIRPLHKFYLASCRAIWPLLPQEESKKGVEITEQYIEGKVSWDELSKYGWLSEAAAFTFDYSNDQTEIERWVKNAESKSAELIKEILNNKPNPRKEINRLNDLIDHMKKSAHATDEDINEMIDYRDNIEGTDTRSLLSSAAYLANSAMYFPSIQPKGTPNFSYLKFMFPDVLRKHVKYPLDNNN